MNLVNTVIRKDMQAVTNRDDLHGMYLKWRDYSWKRIFMKKSL